MSYAVIAVIISTLLMDSNWHSLMWPIFLGWGASQFTRDWDIILCAVKELGLLSSETVEVIHQ